VDGDDLAALAQLLDRTADRYARDAVLFGQLHFTLSEFGQRIGYDMGHISRIENGKRPPTELFAQNEWLSNLATAGILADPALPGSRIGFHRVP
jgi:hypothetical protein